MRSLISVILKLVPGINKCLKKKSSMNRNLILICVYASFKPQRRAVRCWIKMHSARAYGT